MTSTAIKANAKKSTSLKFNPGREEKIAYVFLGVLIILFYMIRSNFFNIPFERDEGAYSYYGKLLLEGGIPYKDFYEQKFPGIFYFYALMVGIFGDTVKGMHIGFTLLNLVTMVVLFFAAKRLFNPFAACVTALTYAIVSMTPTLSGFTVQSEHGVALFTAIGILAYTRTQKDKRWLSYFLMGLALGFAFMVKTTGLFLVLWGGFSVVSDFFFDKPNRNIKEFFKRTLSYSAGVLLVSAIFILIVVFKGALTEMIYWTIDVPRKYVGTIKWEDGKTYLDYAYTSITKDYKFFWMHSAIALGIILLKNIKWNIKFMAVFLAFFSGVTIFPGYYFYGHYWIQILPGLALLSGLTFYGITNFLGTYMKNKETMLQYVYLGIFSVIALNHLNKYKDYYFHPNYDRILRTVYGNNPFPETAKIADYINANSNPEDQIVSLGSEPQIYFYTKKKCPSRHAYFSALVSGAEFHAQWQKEFIADVEKTKPRYVVFYNHGISLMLQPNADRSIFDWYNKYVTDNYTLIGLVDMVEGYSSTYVWKEQLATYQPQAENRIFIFERKKGA